MSSQVCLFNIVINLNDILMVVKSLDEVNGLFQRRFSQVHLGVRDELQRTGYRTQAQGVQFSSLDVVKKYHK